MSVKGQLTASRDFVMAGMRAAARSAMPNQEAEKILRACLDLIEQLLAKPENVNTMQVETTLNVLNQAAVEIERDETPGAPAIAAAVKNAMGRLQTLRSELTTQPK